MAKWVSNEPDRKRLFRPTATGPHSDGDDSIPAARDNATLRRALVGTESAAPTGWSRRSFAAQNSTVLENVQFCGSRMRKLEIDPSGSAKVGTSWLPTPMFRTCNAPVQLKRWPNFRV